VRRSSRLVATNAYHAESHRKPSQLETLDLPAEFLEKRDQPKDDLRE
jgi:hypothetical protein